MTTARRVRQVGRAVGGAARAAAEGASGLANDPKKIDSGLLRFFVYVLLIPIGVVLWRNVRPYSAYLSALLLGQAVQPGEDIPFLGMVAGFSAFAAVQYFEVWPTLLESNAPNQKRAMRRSVALVAYCVDILACYVFWPPIEAGAPAGIMLVQFIDWGNVFTSALTVFGLELWFMLRKLARRAA